MSTPTTHARFYKCPRAPLPQGSWLAVASSTQTVHLFSLDTASSISMVRPGVAPGVHEGGGGGVMRHVREAGGAVIGMLRPMLPHYMRGQGRSAASFQVPDSGPCVVAFDSSLGVGEAERVQVATAGGTFLRFRVGGPQGAVLESHCALGL